MLAVSYTDEVQLKMLPHAEPTRRTSESERSGPENFSHHESDADANGTDDVKYDTKRIKYDTKPSNRYRRFYRKLTEGQSMQ